MLIHVHPGRLARRHIPMAQRFQILSQEDQPPPPCLHVRKLAKARDNNCRVWRDRLHVRDLLSPQHLPPSHVQLLAKRVLGTNVRIVAHGNERAARLEVEHEADPPVSPDAIERRDQMSRIRIPHDDRVGGLLRGIPNEAAVGVIVQKVAPLHVWRVDAHVAERDDDGAPYVHLVLLAKSKVPPIRGKPQRTKRRCGDEADR